MVASAIETSIVFGEFPVANSKLKIARHLNRGSGSILFVLLVIAVLNNLFFAPPMIWGVYGDPSFCPGSLKVGAKEEHNVLLSCSTGDSLSQTPTIIVNRMSTLTNSGTYKVVAVLSESREDNPLVVAVRPKFSDSKLVRSFVLNAMNNTRVDVINSAEYYWGIGETQNTNLGLIDNLVNSGIFNPTSRIDDSIIKQLAEDAISARRLTQITNDLKVAAKPKETTLVDQAEVGSVRISEARQDCSHSIDCAVFSSVHEEMINIIEGPLGKMMMTIMILGAIFATVVSPNLVMFAACVASVLILSNAADILRATMMVQ